jgi:hypothetical protein
LFDQLGALGHARRHFVLHSLDRGGIVGPSRSAPAMRVGDMDGRAQVAVELLRLRQGEGIGKRRQLGRRELLRHKEQQAGRFGERAPFRHQRRNAALWVDREILRRALGLGAEIDPLRLVIRAGFFEGDVRCQRAGSRRVIELEHERRPFLDCISPGLPLG